jgi:carbonic anhydrase
LDANASYQANFGDKANLPAAPVRKFAILTCMDSRLDPAHFAGLREGDAHVIRNAGGRASDDAIRSLVLSHKLLGTQEWFVIHHTGCGLMSVSDEKVRELLAESLDTAVADANGWRNVTSGGGSRAGEYINWLTFTDQTECLVDDVTRLRTHPLVPGNIPIYAYIFDVATGALVEVPEATAAGRRV